MPSEAPTGITGFDEITGGGLPRGRTTLPVGGPGSGKTILALQFLVHGAQDCKEPGIFAAFEETSKRIVGNAESFGWKLAELRRGKLFLLDARPTPDLAAKRREIYRLHEWLLARELTGLITAKAGGDETSSIGQRPFGFVQFMMDCVVILNHSVVLGVSQRNLRVQKGRGSSFDEDESPFLIGKGGLEIAAARTPGHPPAKVTSERVPK